MPGRDSRATKPTKKFYKFFISLSRQRRKRFINKTYVAAIGNSVSSEEEEEAEQLSAFMIVSFKLLFVTLPIIYIYDTYKTPD